jgi:hypothetical protein
MPRKKSLKSTIRELAVQFADGLAEALEERISSERPESAAAPMARAAAPKRAPAGRGRRGSASLEAAGEKLLSAIKRMPGLRNEQLQKEAGLSAAVTRSTLAKLRANGAVRTKGTRRAMVYLPL